MGKAIFTRSVSDVLSVRPPNVLTERMSRQFVLLLLPIIAPYRTCRCGLFLIIVRSCVWLQFRPIRADWSVTQHGKPCFLRSVRNVWWIGGVGIFQEKEVEYVITHANGTYGTQIDIEPNLIVL